MIQTQVKIKHHEEVRSEKRIAITVSSLSHLLSTAPQIVHFYQLFIFCITLLHLEIPQAFLFSPRFLGSGQLNAFPAVLRQGSGKFGKITLVWFRNPLKTLRCIQPNRAPRATTSHLLGVRDPAILASTWVFIGCCLAAPSRARPTLDMPLTAAQLSSQ